MVGAQKDFLPHVVKSQQQSGTGGRFIFTCAQCGQLIPEPDDGFDEFAPVALSRTVFNLLFVTFILEKHGMPFELDESLVKAHFIMNTFTDKAAPFRLLSQSTRTVRYGRLNRFYVAEIPSKHMHVRAATLARLVHQVASSSRSSKEVPSGSGGSPAAAAAAAVAGSPRTASPHTIAIRAAKTAAAAIALSFASDCSPPPPSRGRKRAHGKDGEEDDGE
jgi:hypothetical protein